MQHRERTRIVGRLARLSRRAAASALVAAAVVAAVSIPTTGAYFTADATTTGNTAVAASLPAVEGLAARRSGATTGQSTSVSWNPAAAPAGAGAVTYSVQRSLTADFADPTTVYTGPATTATDTNSGSPTLPAGQPSNTLMGAEASTLSTGSSAACSVLSDGGVSCWGWVNGVERGPGYTASVQTSTGPVRATGAIAGTRIIAATMGQSNACFIALDGSAYCRGDYSGNGNTGKEAYPVAVSRVGALSNDSVSKITMNYSYAAACAMTSRGKVACWGHPHYGAIGSFSDQGVPVTINRGSLATRSVRDITSARSVTCVLATDNTISCWGTDLNGSLGNNGVGTTTNPRIRTTTASEYDLKGSTTPTLIDQSALQGERVRALSGGENTVCALTESSKVFCWGALGTWKAFGARAVRVDTGPLTNISQLEVTRSGLCAVQEGALYCWGTDISGELGLGSPQTREQPTRVDSGVLAGETVQRLSAGIRDTCVLTSAARISCWGLNAWGVADLGRAGTPVRSAGASLITAANTASTCGSAVKLDASRCSLRPDQSYYYRVTYTVGGATKWVSPAATAPRT